MPAFKHRPRVRRVDRIVGRDIVRRRTALGMNQPALAARMKMTQPALSNYEQGKTKFTLLMVMKFGEALDVLWRELLRNLPDELPDKWQ